MVANSDFLRKAIRFAFTGIFVTGVHALTALVFIEKYVMFPALANGLAFIGATVFSYIINTIWSFSAGIRRETLVKFLVVSIIGFCLAMSIAWLVQWLGLNYLIGICAVALTIPPITFVLHNFWTYK